MNVVTLRQGRLASIDSFSPGSKALGNTSPQGPQDSVAIFGVRNGMARLIDCDGDDNLRLRLENADNGDTTLLLQNPGSQDSPTVAIALGVHVPADESWFSPEVNKLGPGVKQVSVRPFEGGASVEVVDSSTAEWTFSAQGVVEPSIAACATLSVPEAWQSVARQALQD